MTEPLTVTDPCATSLQAILANPLDPGPEVEAHLRACGTCSEARIAFLAQEEAPLTLAPTGYFERLPERVVRKLPARPRLRHRLPPMVWAAAAVLLLAVGVGAFWVGRANATPYVEAALPRTPSEVQELPMDTPFDDQQDAVSQLTALSQQDAEAVLNTLRTRQDAPPAQP